MELLLTEKCLSMWTKCQTSFVLCRLSLKILWQVLLIGYDELVLCEKWNTGFTYVHWMGTLTCYMFNTVTCTSTWFWLLSCNWRSVTTWCILPKILQFVVTEHSSQCAKPAFLYLRWVLFPLLATIADWLSPWGMTDDVLCPPSSVSGWFTVLMWYMKGKVTLWQ